MFGIPLGAILQISVVLAFTGFITWGVGKYNDSIRDKERAELEAKLEKLRAEGSRVVAAANKLGYENAVQLNKQLVAGLSKYQTNQLSQSRARQEASNEQTKLDPTYNSWANTVVHGYASERLRLHELAISESTARRITQESGNNNLPSGIVPITPEVDKSWLPNWFNFDKPTTR